jgi:hypothetical protein
MIESLISSVQQAEAHAGADPATPEQPALAEPYTPRTYQFNQTSIIEDLLGVA